MGEGAKVHFGSGTSERQEDWKGKATRYLNLGRLIINAELLNLTSPSCSIE